MKTVHSKIDNTAFHNTDLLGNLVLFIERDGRLFMSWEDDGYEEVEVTPLGIDGLISQLQELKEVIK